MFEIDFGEADPVRVAMHELTTPKQPIKRSEKPADLVSLGVEVGEAVTEKLQHGQRIRPLIVELDQEGEDGEVPLTPFYVGLNVALEIATLNTTVATYQQRLGEISGLDVMVERLDGPDDLYPDEQLAIHPTDPNIQALDYEPRFPAVRITPVYQSGQLQMGEVHEAFHQVQQ